MVNEVLKNSHIPDRDSIHLACIYQPLGAKVEFPEPRELANAFTNIPIHFGKWKVQLVDSLKIVITMLYLPQ